MAKTPQLGKIQQSIVNYLSRCGEAGGFICSTTKAQELSGLDLAQVERALGGLTRRGLVRKEGGHRYGLDRAARSNTGGAVNG